MTQNTSANPSSTPATSEEESVTDYLLRKISSKKTVTPSTTKTEDTPPSLTKAPAEASTTTPSSGGVSLFSIIISMMVIGVIAAVLTAAISIIS
jgi:hypothetical protein